MNQSRTTPGSSSLRTSGDRWLFGYADVVTLLFACFAALYAAQVSESAAAATTPVMPDAPVVQATPASPEPLDALEQELDALIAREAGSTNLELRASDRGLVLSLEEAGSFPAGQSDLTPGARRVMASVALAINRVPNQVRVEGHTDDVPIHTARFRSNWELSTARATEVVQFLIAEGAVAPDRLSAAGYGEHRPRVTNASAAARARNRRVDIVILGDAAAAADAPVEMPR